MKSFLIIFVILILVFPFVNAARVNLNLNESYSDDGRNITLLGIDNKRDKVLICVNNERAILSKERQKTVKDVSLFVKKVADDEIRVVVKVYCEECECDNTCLNTECIKFGEVLQEEIEEEILEEIVETNLESNNEVIENPGLSASNISLALAILILFAVSLYYLIKR